MVGHAALGMRASIHLVLRLVMWRRLLLLRMLLWMRSKVFVCTETWTATVLYILDMRSENALLRMRFGLSSIVDIWICIVARSIRHAGIGLPPQLTALAGRRGQDYYVLDHCWVALCFQEARGLRSLVCC